MISYQRNKSSKEKWLKDYVWFDSARKKPIGSKIICSSGKNCLKIYPSTEEPKRKGSSISQSEEEANWKKETK